MQWESVLAAATILGVALAIVFCMGQLYSISGISATGMKE